MLSITAERAGDQVAVIIRQVGGVLISETHHGLKMANAGGDARHFRT